MEKNIKSINEIEEDNKILKKVNFEGSEKDTNFSLGDYVIFSGENLHKTVK